MCTRLSQHRKPETYFSQFPVHPFVPRPLSFVRSYNVAPGTQPLYIRETEDDYVATTARWGYQHGADRMCFSTHLEGATRSGHWRPLWEGGRIIVPVDGWFEWTGPDADRQPWFIYSQAATPLWFAALLGDDGFAILTRTADRELQAVHSRRPVALDIRGAREWMAPGTTSDDALQIAAERVLPESELRWHAVTRAVANDQYQEEDAVRPINLPS